MTRKLLLMIFIGTLFFLDAGICRAHASDHHQNAAEAFTDLGLQFYGKMLYGRALQYFEEARTSAAPMQDHGLIDYARKVLTRYTALLGEIEELNRRVLDPAMHAELRAKEKERLRNMH
ncbi:MAG: hypothetical protein WCG78_03735, partial [Candidatus Omnitrophota bacterium]